MPHETFTLAVLADILSGKLSAPLCGGTAVGIPFTDSKRGAEGGLFVALCGVKADGHDFIEDAFSHGAAAAVVSSSEKLGGRPGIIVGDTRAAMSRLSAYYAGEPTDTLRVAGITGTNGKTTIHWLMGHALERLGEPALRLGTLGFAAPGIVDTTMLTTPDPLVLHKCLRKGLEAGARAAVMEVSSHALVQRRADDVQFDVGIFTNLTRDHLDYHGTMEEYYRAKRRLFELIANGRKTAKAAVINIDDEYGRRLFGECEDMGLHCRSYGRHPSAMLRIENFRQDFRGSAFALHIGGRTFEVASPFIGLHNAHNIAAAAGGCIALGYAPVNVLKALCTVPPVPGRLEPVGTEEMGVYVDYAHTPDALINVLSTLRELVKGTLWVVFGCGGDRDRGKRPEMASAAEQYADHVVVTSDNPRTEDPRAIIEDILSKGARPEIVEPDRRKAIRGALTAARPGDVVLIAGKGHEDYQIIGTQKLHFSDQEEVREFLRGRGGEQ